MKPLCVWCGRPTYSPKRVCHSCRTVERNKHEYSPDDALTGGRWVLGPRRVLVWEVDAA